MCRRLGGHSRREASEAVLCKWAGAALIETHLADSRCVLTARKELTSKAQGAMDFTRCAKLAPCISFSTHFEDAERAVTCNPWQELQLDIPEMENAIVGQSWDKLHLEGCVGDIRAIDLKHRLSWHLHYISRWSIDVIRVETCIRARFPHAYIVVCLSHKGHQLA